MDEAAEQQKLEFLRSTQPFAALGWDDLRGLAQGMEEAFYPKGRVVIQVGGPPSGHLHLIRQGAARITLPQGDGRELLVDMRAEGDHFGAVSLLQGSKALFQVTAAEEMACYLIPRQVFLGLMAAHPEVKRHFDFALARNLRAAVKEAQREQQTALAGLGGAGLDAAALRSRVGDLMTREVLTCLPATTLRAAAHLMSMRGVGSIVVADEGNHPLGILTDHDLRARVVARGLGSDVAVAEVMTQPALAVSPAAYAFEALLLMSSHGVHHLPVTQEDRVVGVICDHDFQALTGSSPVGVMRDIGKVTSLEELVRLHSRMDRVLETVLKAGGQAVALLALISEFNDRLTLKLLELTESAMEHAGLGRPPTPYVWMALGSEGRREQTLRTDQDNALIHANLGGREGKDDPRAKAVRDWFLAFAQRVVDGLERLGFPRCAGGVMASNPQWCQSERAWGDTFAGWIADPNPLTLRMASIFFDFRAIYAEADFIESLSARLGLLIEEHRAFLRHMAKNALYNSPPLGFLRQFVLEKSGEHQHQLNLKLSGLTPMVDAMRVMALELGVLQPNTMERLAAVAQAGLIPADLAEDLREAFNFIVILRIGEHLQARAQGRPPDNYIAPAKLNQLQRKMLKESFAVIRRLQDLMEYRYQTRGMLG